MKKSKIAVLSLMSAGILAGGVMTVSALGGPQNNADILSKITGKSVADISTQRTEENKTYGEIASENGVLDEFKEAKLESTKEVVAGRVENGSLTQEQADQIISNMEENMTDCNGDGTGGNAGLGLGTGAHDGSGQGQGQMLRDGSHSGTGRGNGGTGQGMHR